MVPARPGDYTHFGKLNAYFVLDVKLVWIHKPSEFHDVEFAGFGGDEIVEG